jgi:surface polysaccharide O-acyltransferase-like enzyme
MPTVKIVVVFFLSLQSLAFISALFNEFKKNAYERELNESAYWFMGAFIIVSAVIIYFITKPKIENEDIANNPFN